jgi:Rrf2 family transcriptional regulator, iron-sulfur cluster assembly transcription factor
MRLSLTKQTEYALRALVWLAQTDLWGSGGASASHQAPNIGVASHVGSVNSDSGLVRHKAAEIADATSIPPVFATRVLAHLQRQGLLHARAGQQGGYTLARPASQITLLEVIEAVEGPLVTLSCVLREAGCGVDGTYCILHDAWSRAQEALRDTLAQTTLDSAIATVSSMAVTAWPPLIDEPIDGLPADAVSAAG